MLYLKDVGQIVHHYYPNEYIAWSVPNILADDGSYCITSRSFSYLNETWCLALIKPFDGRGISLFLWCCEPLKQKYFVRLHFLNYPNVPFRQLKKVEGPVDLFGHFGSRNFFDSNEAWTDLKHGILIFSCEIERLAEEDKSLSKSKDVPGVKIDTTKKELERRLPKKELKSLLPKKDVPRLVQNLKNLYLEKQVCDVVLKASGREFSAHKAILVAQSPVFAAMFKHDMAEKNSGIVDIPDCSPEAFDIFLLYLYSGELENLCTKTMYDVYNAAVKYNVDDLRNECVDYITSHLSVDNFCDIMTLVLQCDEEKMKTCASSFFHENVKEIVKTNRWVEFMVENPVQANELYKKIINA